MRLLLLQRLGLFGCVLFAVTFLRELAPVRDISALPDLPLFDPWLRATSFDFLLEAADRGKADVFPLYPELVRALGRVFSLPLAALLVSNVALAAAVVALEALVSVEDVGLAPACTLAVVYFPSSFLLSAGNDLSLFLACALGTFAAEARKNEKLAAACALAGVLSHPLGALTLSVPFLAKWWTLRRYGAQMPNLPRFTLAVPMGLLLLAGFSRLNTGDALRLPCRALMLTGLSGQSAVAQLTANLPAIELTTGYGVLLDWAAIALGLAAAVHCFRRKEYAFSCFALVFLLGYLRLHASPARWFESVSLVFPVYVALARWFAHAAAGKVLAIAAPMLQVTCAVLFAAGLWGT
jgi:hypothetical protein